MDVFGTTLRSRSFPACILPKKRGLTSAVVPVSCTPHPAHTACEQLIFKGPILHFEMRTIVWICDIKKILFHLEYIVHLLALKREHEVSLCGRPVDAALRQRVGDLSPRVASGDLPDIGHVWSVTVYYTYLGDFLNRNASAVERVCSTPSCVLPIAVRV